LLDEFPESRGISPIGEAERVVETLRGGAVLVREFPELRRVREALPLICKASDDQPRHVLAELERNERRDLIGGVLLASHHGTSSMSNIA
jgi:hypothetical protein